MEREFEERDRVVPILRRIKEEAIAANNKNI